MRIRNLAATALVILALWGCMANEQEQTSQTRSNEGYKVPPSYNDPSGLPATSAGIMGRMKGEGYEAGRFDPEMEKDPQRRRHTEWSQDFDEFLLVEAPTGRLGGLEFTEGRMPRVRGGELRTRIENRVVPLPLKHTDVNAQLTLNIGSVTLTQQYHNPYAGKIEAVYLFPLPDDAAVRDFVMVIGDRRIRGIIREREEAKQIYLEARRQGHVASLMTQERPNIFMQSVANIEPGKQIDIQITYFHTLRCQDRTFEFVFPMVVGPRYNPAGFSDGVGAVAAGANGASGQKTEVQYLRPEEISLADIGLQVHIDAGAEIEDVSSPTHAIKSERIGPASAKVTLSPNDRIPNRDFVLRYRIAGRDLRAGLAVHKDADGGTFALMIHPPPALLDVPRGPREMIFVIDCSGSMSGRPIDTAKRALVKCLKRLEADDTFRILAFSDHVWSMTDAPVAANPGNVARGVTFTEALRAGGGTELQEVVRVALDTPVAAERFRIVAFLTDGFIGNDREVVSFARTHLGSARIFSYGVGDSVNRYLLEALARVGRGICAIVTLDESSEKAADDLFRHIEHPALRDLRIDWGGMAAADVQPNPLPDVYVGRPVTLIGRYKGEGPSKVRISGRAGAQPVEMELAVNVDDPGQRHSALPAVWARSKITGLHDAMLGSGDPREFAQEIRAVALRHGLLSEFTSFIAVDSLTRTAGEFGTTVVQPMPVPSGVRYDTTVEKK
ncbi:MAG TPA: VIT and VWA domain-containing protein [Planctomycetota bacterium]|nr:VIT and VWA domain-containing protein [Planctomycetota bacterium]